MSATMSVFDFANFNVSNSSFANVYHCNNCDEERVAGEFTDQETTCASCYKQVLKKKRVWACSSCKNVWCSECNKLNKKSAALTPRGHKKSVTAADDSAEVPETAPTQPPGAEETAATTTEGIKAEAAVADVGDDGEVEEEEEEEEGDDSDGELPSAEANDEKTGETVRRTENYSVVPYDPTKKGERKRARKSAKIEEKERKRAKQEDFTNTVLDRLDALQTVTGQLQSRLDENQGRLENHDEQLDKLAVRVERVEREKSVVLLNCDKGGRWQVEGKVHLAADYIGVTIDTILFRRGVITVKFATNNDMRRFCGGTDTIRWFLGQGVVCKINKPVDDERKSCAFQAFIEKVVELKWAFRDQCYVSNDTLRVKNETVAVWKRRQIVPAEGWESILKE